MKSIQKFLFCLVLLCTVSSITDSTYAITRRLRLKAFTSPMLPSPRSIIQEDVEAAVDFELKTLRVDFPLQYGKMQVSVYHSKLGLIHSQEVNTNVKSSVTFNIQAVKGEYTIKVVNEFYNAVGYISYD